jgi:hypothetical protein
VASSPHPPTSYNQSSCSFLVTTSHPPLPLVRHISHLWPDLLILQPYVTRPAIHLSKISLFSSFLYPDLLPYLLLRRALLFHQLSLARPATYLWQDLLILRPL